MISVSGKNWEETKINKRILDKIKIENNFSEIEAKIIVSRNFDHEEIYSINNQLKISNPFYNVDDFSKCFQTLNNVMFNKGKILIIGDYDVDGSVATALMIKFLKNLNYPFDFYIPDRVKDGYGASLKLIKNLVKSKPNLIIMLDCGSNSNDSVDYLNDSKIDTIIIDHHDIYQPYPNTENLINPKKKCTYNLFNYLCSTTLTYFFIDFCFKKKKITNNFSTNLIYVLLATVCDVMPLRKLNRTIAIDVLNNFDINKNNIFKQIYKISNKKNLLNINDLGFLFGPILNSTGRISNSSKATKLLITNNEEEQNKLIDELILLNQKRKNIEDKIINDIDLNKINKNENEVIVLNLNNINEGLIGIIAARIKEYFNKPTIIFTKTGNISKGSARSTDNFNIGKYIKLAIDKKIILSGGGHSLAAGVTIENDKINIFSKFINSQYNLIYKTYNLKQFISKISLSSVNLNFFNSINKLAPFGSGNHNPLFLIENLKVFKTSIIKNKYINCVLKSLNGKSINSISFNLFDSRISEILLNYKKEIKIIGQINQNLWNNKKTLQINIVDVII
ncbi:MAG: single-stranded-DNA-specific exonuclease RecJ [Pelagibacteraceae bacterium]|nr:single-stranded-DNA-specific exonuclease RecJ [Pelagibacteraceae bacterium]